MMKTIIKPATLQQAMPPEVQFSIIKNDEFAITELNENTLMINPKTGKAFIVFQVLHL
jgi:hypothetical protein